MQNKFRLQSEPKATCLKVPYVKFWKISIMKIDQMHSKSDETVFLVVNLIFYSYPDNDIVLDASENIMLKLVF